MRFSPVTKLSFSLVLITVSILLLGSLLGLIPDKGRIVMNSRTKLCESLALQLSFAAANGQITTMRHVVVPLVERNKDILSIAIRTQGDALIVSAGDHLTHWTSEPGADSTLSNIQIPIFKGKEQWATMEISFIPIWNSGFLSLLSFSSFGLVLFVVFTGYPLYYFFMKRTLRALDPSAVIPARVKAAFDVFEEGVMLMDEKEQVIMTNASFGERIGKRPEELIGFHGSEFAWIGFDNKEDRKGLPWVQVLNDGKSRTGVSMSFRPNVGNVLKFIVNSSPIVDSAGNLRGVLVTCDDVTELEEKNYQLHEMVGDLQESHKEIEYQNEKLEFLATHDPMTHLLNRRAFNAKFDEMFSRSKQEGAQLSFIMTDIDHFKRVNDTHGHSVGDKVIIAVADILQKHVRKTDIAGRYGGEEFCLVFPGMQVEKAAQIAEEIRIAIKNDESSGVPVTNSFGVSSLADSQAETPQELLDEADKALYVAKESGRNRVVIWDETAEAQAIQEPSPEEESGEKQDVAEQEERRSRDTEVQRLSVRLKELEKREQEHVETLEHYSTHDSVTGLSNRAVFEDCIERAVDRGNRFDRINSVLSVSIETIGKINDVLGHSIAEKLLRLCGERLSDTLRTIDTVASLSPTSSGDMEKSLFKLGQEEFGVLVTDVQHVDAITWIVKRLLDSFTERFVVQHNDIYVTINVGISIFPYDGETAKDLQQSAAAARRYAKKTLGPNSYHFYFEEVNNDSVKQLQIEGQLQEAISKKEFELYYQPIVDTETAQIVGMEALIRWNNPRSGLMLPNDFLSIAEYSGLIIPIGDWVLEAACHHIRLWSHEGFGKCTIAVNLSAKQIHVDGFVGRLKEIVVENGIDPGLLKIEVTESVMMKDIEKSIEVLKEINLLGIEISIDDFGTGYSSLSYLKKFPAQYIKIDRSFTADIETNEKDSILVGSFIKMAHSMGLKVIAEGVENRAQYEILADFKCDMIQGYLLSRPVPAKDALVLLGNGFEGIVS